MQGVAEQQSCNVWTRHINQQFECGRSQASGSIDNRRPGRINHPVDDRHAGQWSEIIAVSLRRWSVGVVPMVVNQFYCSPLRPLPYITSSPFTHISYDRFIMNSTVRIGQETMNPIRSLIARELINGLLEFTLIVR